MMNIELYFIINFNFNFDLNFDLAINYYQNKYFVQLDHFKYWIKNFKLFHNYCYYFIYFNQLIMVAHKIENEIKFD